MGVSYMLGRNPNPKLKNGFKTSVLNIRCRNIYWSQFFNQILIYSAGLITLGLAAVVLAVLVSRAASTTAAGPRRCFYEYTFEECEHFLLQWSRRPSFAISWRHRNERSESKGPIFPYNVDWSLPIHTKGESLLDNAPNYYLLGVLSKREVSCCFLFLLLIIIKSILHTHPSDCLFKK